nr:hypothetical protein [Candidatus Sigynarchaeota archaeon]
MNWTNNGIAICNSFNSSSDFSASTDFSSGAIVAWKDTRNETSTDHGDIYAQIITPTGEGLLKQNGTVIANRTGTQKDPLVCSDGEFGAIIVYVDDNSGWDQVYAQRIDRNGTKMWGDQGIALTNTGYNCSEVQIAASWGTVFVCWTDYRNGNPDIYAQYLHKSGGVFWPQYGVPVCNDTSDQFHPVATHDGNLGTIIAWQDGRSGAGNFDIYAQYVMYYNATKKWSLNGVPICSAPFNQESPMMCNSGEGILNSPIIAWLDHRANSGTGNDVYVQRVNASGSAMWATDGIEVSSAASELEPVIGDDFKSGAIVAWVDTRNADNDIYGQHVDSSGTLLWGANGLNISTAPQDQSTPHIDVLNNGIINYTFFTWQDERDGNADIYVQKVLFNGTCSLPENGVPACIETSMQAKPKIIQTGGYSSAIVIWEDNRSGTTDIYANQIKLNFPPVLVQGPNDASTHVGEILEVSWVLHNDISGGTYRILVNGS